MGSMDGVCATIDVSTANTFNSEATLIKILSPKQAGVALRAFGSQATLSRQTPVN